MTTPDSLLAEESTTGTVIESDAGASVWGNTPALTVLAICAVILLLRYMQEVFIPFVLAGLTFYALDPMVDWLQRWRVPRSIGAALMLLLLVGTIGLVGYTLSDDVSEVANDLPAATQKLRATLRANRNQPPGAMEKLQQAATEIDKTAAEATGTSLTPSGVVRVRVEEPAIQLSEVPPLGSRRRTLVRGRLDHGVLSRVLSARRR